MAESGAVEGGHSPLVQFEIHTLVPINIGSLDLSFTNSSLMMVIALLLASGFMLIGMRRGTLVPGRWQCAAEITYEFVGNLIRETVGTEAMSRCRGTIPSPASGRHHRCGALRILRLISTMAVHRLCVTRSFDTLPTPVARATDSMV